MRLIGIVSLAAFLVSVPTGARGQEDMAEASVAAINDTSASVRSYSEDWMILPERRYNFTGVFTFMTADGGLGEGRVKFTDVVLLSLSGRTSLSGKAEVYGGVSLLPKQPSFTNERIWQSANLGLRVGFKKRYASFLSVEGGSLMNKSGYMGATSLGLQARKSIDRNVFFQGSVGGSGTVLFPDQGTDQAFWLSEAFLSGEIVFHGRRAPGFWLGTQFRFPIAENPGKSAPDPMTGGYLDSQTRVNVYAGFALTFIDKWNIFTKFVIADRGDLVDPNTTLPILNGGFDQKQWIFGLTRRFERKKSVKKPLDIAQ